MIKFIFDLDGTITAEETLPIISKNFNLVDEMENLTRETVQGNIPFIESFIRRVYILGKLPVDEISELLRKAELYSEILNFIKTYKENCVIATSNLECWCIKLLEDIGCAYYCSDATVEENQVKKLTRILKKESVVERYKSAGDIVVYIGDGNNDMEAMRLADISIATGLTHYPAKSLLSVADYLVFSEEALCRQLSQLL
ncbi:HAD-IB family phosphatase [Anaeromicropila herbilytica]|uniref:phosphoserine phosphatase n=1 Tax=Anaeromicropila herbilytica TaxID=2785025 RepID=A0A7R7IEV6_9FIRM|nr:HAD-IB family phosphatase [Anaeromicropila herbilytica]BCN32524.1 hypothetical protein bsdtb5_38190 [Anaeromicropila herbilytica]